MRVPSALVVPVVLLALLSIASPGMAAQVSAYAADVAVTRNGGLVTVAYRIRVVNREATAVTGLTVDDYSGHTLYVGDIDPGGEGLSTLTQYTIDIGDWPSQSLMVPITLHYTLQAQPVDLNSGLSFSLSQ